MIDRRRFLAAAPVAAWAARETLVSRDRPILGPRAGKPAVASHGRLPGWGVQLYTLRDVMADRPEETLEALAEIGYAEVELAGLYGRSPAEMRSMLDAVGLRAASSHHGLDEVRDDWERTLDGALILGQRLIVVPSIPGGERSPGALRRVADDFDRAAETAARVDLRFGYHNHDWEFEPAADGTVPMDLLLDLTDPRLVDWQMDVFWTVHGGADPIAAIEARSGRVTSLHLKDRTPDGTMVAVGEGAIDFGSIVTAAETAGLRHAFVEHDRPEDSLDSVRRSFAGLRRLEPS